MQKSVTIILPVSRAEHLPLVFSALENLECDRNKTSLLVIVDGNEELFVHTRNIVVESKFTNNLTLKYESSGPLELIDERRFRIADIHNFAKGYVGDSEYIFGIEDDTVVPSDALQKLLFAHTTNPYAGFVSGLELGRWRFPYIGAWEVDDIYEPTEIVSIEMNETPIREIDAAGFYCFLTRKEIYTKHKFETFENGGAGPDVNFGITLRREGFSNFIDTTIRCTHLTGNTKIQMVSDNHYVRVKFVKKKNRWAQRLI